MNMGVSQDQINTLKDDIKRDGIQKIIVGAVIRRDDAVLLLKRQADDFMGGLVELPSGTVDSGEEILDALGEGGTRRNRLYNSLHGFFYKYF